jgi:hypothetical protein
MPLPGGTIPGCLRFLRPAQLSSTRPLRDLERLGLRPRHSTGPRGLAACCRQSSCRKYLVPLPTLRKLRPSLLLAEPINQAELMSGVRPLRDLVRPLKRKAPVSNRLPEVRIPLAEQRKEAQRLLALLPPRKPPTSPWRGNSTFGKTRAAVR